MPAAAVDSAAQRGCTSRPQEGLVTELDGAGGLAGRGCGEAETLVLAKECRAVPRLRKAACLDSYHTAQRFPSESGASLQAGAASAPVSLPVQRRRRPVPGCPRAGMPPVPGCPSALRRSRARGRSAGGRAWRAAETG